MASKFRGGLFQIQLSQPISRNMFAIATAMWHAKQPINEKSLAAACKATRVKFTAETVKDMVILSDLLNRACPA